MNIGNPPMVTNASQVIESQLPIGWRILEIDGILSEEYMTTLEGTTVTGEKVSVGVVCGPMTLRTAEWINLSSRLPKNRYGSVQFVAMNRAAENDRFNYTASFLAAYFSELFSGSPHWHTQATWSLPTLQMHIEKISIFSKLQRILM